MKENGKSKLALNGINATTGEPLEESLTIDDVCRLVCSERWNEDDLRELKDRAERLREDHADVDYGIDPRRLDETGWGVIFPEDAAPEVRDALKPLCEHRRSQAGRRNEDYYRELVYFKGESKTAFLSRHGVGPEPEVHPEDIPYYLLIVGGPEEVPFPFQHQLDVPYAVGRICFDTPEEYARYAESVVAAEAGRVERERRMTFFGVENHSDPATERTRNQLVEPLAESLQRAAAGWEIGRVLGEEATKSALGELLGGGRAPALAFTASHGVGFNPDDPRQLDEQGALLCQDWPGVGRWRGRIPPEHYFSAGDVAGSADVAGLIAFFVACYGAGTPERDSFPETGEDRGRIAPRSFVARLPQRLLAHPRGGALAVVGHVDRAWTWSFDWPGAKKHIRVFESALRRLADGYPIGAAMEPFDQRYALLSSDLSYEIERVNRGRKPDVIRLSQLWTANNDARSYTVVGDPAVRLAACDAP